MNTLEKWRQKAVCVAGGGEEAETSMSTEWNRVEGSRKSFSKELTCRWIVETISQKERKGFPAERNVD